MLSKNKLIIHYIFGIIILFIGIVNFFREILRIRYYSVLIDYSGLTSSLILFVIGIIILYSARKQYNFLRFDKKILIVFMLILLLIYVPIIVIGLLGNRDLGYQLYLIIHFIFGLSPITSSTAYPYFYLNISDFFDIFQLLWFVLWILVVVYPFSCLVLWLFDKMKNRA